MKQVRSLAQPGPTAPDLAAIEREWPLIAAELALVDAEIALLQAGGRVSALDRRRVRRAEQRVAREAAALAPPELTTAGLVGPALLGQALLVVSMLRPAY